MTYPNNEDVLYIPLNDQEQLVIASDNNGAIGMKPCDEVVIPYDVVSYYAFRVAYMDCVAAGGEPIAINLMNFNGDDVWNTLLQGINQGINELNIDHLPITGSTESNFSLKQSATSLTVLGKSNIQQKQFATDNCHIALIGHPLVGDDVITYEEKIAPLELFQWFAEQEDVIQLLPVGSKGIAYELAKVIPTNHITISADIDVTQSSGPATCFIAFYAKSFHPTALEKAGQYLNDIKV